LEIFRDHLMSAVFDEQDVREFVGRYGPFEPEIIEEYVQFAVEEGGADQHIHTLLSGLRLVLGGTS
jgi:hypothetical protein